MKTKTIIIITVLLISIFNLRAQSNYKTIKIGKQEWTANNLNVTTFRNGDAIPKAESASEWEKAGREHKPAWCYQQFNENTNSSDNLDDCGKLYNWYAINDARGLASKGWHLPTKAEWNILIKYLGDSIVAGKKMRWDIDSIGFAARPVGYRYADGENDHKHGYAKNTDEERDMTNDYYGYSDDASFWSSTQSTDFNACYISLSFYNSNVFFGNTDRGNGRSCRLVKD